MTTHFLRTTALATLVAGLPLAALAQEPVTLRMALWTGNEAHLALFNEIAAGFAETHPGVTVTYDTLPFAEYTTTLTTQIAGGNAPDMAWIFESSAYDFVKSGALYPLTDTLKATEGYDLEDFSPTIFERWSQDGEIFAYPFSNSPFAIFVNNDLIRAAGDETPAELMAKGEWTWDNAIKLAADVSATGKAGLVLRDFNFQRWEIAASIWNAWGAEPWSADGKTCELDSPEMVEAMSFIHDAVFTSHAMPEPGENVDFFAGDAAMTISQISRASLLPTEGGFDWDLLPMPAGKVGEYALLGQAGVGVLKASKHAEVAAEFIAYMTNPENSAKLGQFFPSGRNSLLNAEVLKTTNPRLSVDQIENVVVKGIQTGAVVPGHTGFAQIQQTVRAGLDAMWLADADVAGTLTRVCGQIAPMLKR